MSMNEIATSMDLLADADREVRVRAAVDLGTRRAEEAAQALVARLGVEPSHAVRETLTWAVLRMPDAARPHLDAALGSDRWLARWQAAHVLSKLGDPVDADRLLPVIADPVDAVASRAWWAAGQTGAASVVPAMTAQLGRGDRELRNSLSIALAELGERPVGALVAALRSAPEASIREHAADTLALLGSPVADRAALALAEALADDDPGVRLAVLNALGQLRGPIADEALSRARGSADRRESMLAARLLERRPASGARRNGVASRRRSATGTATPLAATSGVAASGLVAAADGVLVELLCGTDLVAGGTTFRSLGQRIAELAATLPGCARDDLLAAPLDDVTVAEALAALSASTGETVALGTVARLPGRTVSYLHQPVPGGLPRIGALVGVDGVPDAERLGRVVAAQVATCSPRFLTLADVPQQVWDEVRAAAEARAQGRPQAMADRIVAGELAAFATETVLFEQVSIADPEVTVETLLYGRGVRVTGFRRVEVGAPSEPDRTGRR